MAPEIRERIRTPFLTMLALLGMFSINVVLGIFFIRGFTWIVEVFIAVCMVATVIWFAMEARHDPPLTRLFSAIGFFWVAILFSLTMLDYATR